MSAILIRFGLYTILAMLALFVATEQFELPIAEFLTGELLARMGLAGLTLVALGALLAIFEKAKRKSPKGRCVVCRKPVLVGNTYCREHLRQVIAEEQDRAHASIRR